MTTPALLEVRDVGASVADAQAPLWRRSRISLLRNVSFRLQPGEVMGLVGESGSGKTTLARLIMGLMRPDSGAILLQGHDTTRMTRRDLARVAQMVFQDPSSSLNPRQSVRTAILRPLWALGGTPDAGSDVLLDQAMQACGLPARLRLALPASLSGGQRQRVAIARALILRPALIVLDEPTSALDVSVQAQIITLLHDLRRDLGLSYVFISHNLGVVEAIADQVCVLCRGEVVEQGPAARVFQAPAHAYTQTLLASVLSVRYRHRAG